MSLRKIAETRGEQTSYFCKFLRTNFGFMGLLFSKIASIFGAKEARILILGLDNSGKTTILYKLHSPEQMISNIPTIGFNVEQITIKNLNFQVWDLGGQTNIRPYWRCYYPNTNGIIFVVDSNDTERLPIARQELMNLLSEEELQNVSILVFANKQDLPNAKSVGEVSEGLGLPEIKGRTWHIQEAVATEGTGLLEGFEWLADQV